MTASYENIIRDASAPIRPVPTGVEPHLPSLPGIRAVVFDIYGTLLVSASGDIGATNRQSRESALQKAFDSLGLRLGCPAEEASSLLTEMIHEAHDESRAGGIDYPEVDIVEIWRNTIAQLVAAGAVDGPTNEIDFRRLAVEFEVRANPVWPMPGLAECLDGLHGRGMIMGIISNAQFFTPLVFPAIAGKTVDQFGFAPELRYYSYEHGHAKPGRELYDLAAAGLTEMNLSPSDVLYVGNDMRNDIWPAAEAGFRTVLFAGDRRSLRLRTDEAPAGAPAGTQGPAPDAVVTELRQIFQILDLTD